MHSTVCSKCHCLLAGRGRPHGAPAAWQLVLYAVWLTVMRHMPSSLQAMWPFACRFLTTALMMPSVDLQPRQESVQSAGHMRMCMQGSLCGEQCKLQVTVSAPWDEQTGYDDTDALNGQPTRGRAKCNAAVRRQREVVAELAETSFRMIGSGPTCTCVYR